MVKLKTMANTEDQIAKIKEFERKLQANEIHSSQVTQKATPFMFDVANHHLEK